MKYKNMRDVFFDRLYDMAKADKDIVLISVDIGAPSLDKYRKDLPSQFINTGISEQNAILVASGMQLAGKKVIVYGITQFIILRCFEQIRLYPAGMNIPITIVGQGAGTSYWECGMTHHCIEDVSLMRVLPHFHIYNASDLHMAQGLADIAVNSKNPIYIRFDRDAAVESHSEGFSCFERGDGFRIIKDISETNLIVTGCMVEYAKKISEMMEDSGNIIGVIEIFRLPVNKSSFINTVHGSKKLVTLEEHTLSGGMGSYILEMLSDEGLNINVKRLGFDTSMGYKGLSDYGGREAIRKDYGLDFESIAARIKEMNA